MILICDFVGRVVTKSVVTSNDKQYFNVGIVCNGSLGEIGCTPEVFNQVKENETYKFIFDLNTAYLKKDCSCFIRIKDIADPDDGKKGGK